MRCRSSSAKLLLPNTYRTSRSTYLRRILFSARSVATSLVKQSQHAAYVMHLQPSALASAKRPTSSTIMKPAPPGIQPSGAVYLSSGYFLVA